jgi:nitrogenase-associated protein
MEIVFWEKPGCMGNARQKALLAQAGHSVVPHSLPGSVWTREGLLEWLDGIPVPDWFNRGARRVKEGEVDPDSVEREEALSILAADPILIRRPLVELAGVKMVGFDLERIESITGAFPDTERIRRVRAEDLSSCGGHGIERPRCGSAGDEETL